MILEKFGLQRLRLNPIQTTILGFDTSGLNALHRGGPDVAPMLAGLDTGYAIRLNGTALDEIVAHSLPKERERLRELCRKLLTNCAGDVLLPFHEITTRVAVAFESGRPFDWTRVDVRSNEYMRFIFDDDVSALGTRTVGVNPLVRQFNGYTVSLPHVPRKPQSSNSEVPLRSSQIV